MNEPVTLHKTAEGKYAFPDQRAYDQAVEAMIKSPDSNMSELQALMDSGNVVVSNDNSGQPLAAAEPQAPANAAVADNQHTDRNPSIPQGIVDRLRQRAKEHGVELSYQDEEQIINGLINKEKYISFQKNQLSGMVSKEELQKAIEKAKDLEERLKKVEQTPPLENPVAPNNKGQAATESKKPQIDYLRKRLKDIEDPHSDEALDIERELRDLMFQELERIEKAKAQSSSGGESYSEVLEMVKEVRESFQEIKKETAEEREKEKLKTRYESDLKAIEVLQEKHPEFKTSRGMQELDADYRKWITELFRMRHGRLPENSSEMKILSQEYMNGDSDVSMIAKQNGLEEPQEVRKYLDICDLIILRDRLQPVAGKEVSLEEAFKHRMVIDGSIDDAMLQQRELGARAIKNGQTNRDTNYARQLDQSSGASSVETGDTMSPETAIKVMNSISPEQAARDPEKKKLIDQAFMVISQTAAQQGV